MMFTFVWTGRRFANDADERRGLDAAYQFCAKRGLNPGEIYEAALAEVGGDVTTAVGAWWEIELAAIQAMDAGWCAGDVYLDWEE